MLYTQSPNESEACPMKNAMKFDPCRSARTLIEMLFDNGMAQEALALTKSVDDAQLKMWNDGETLKKVNNG